MKFTLTIFPRKIAILLTSFVSFLTISGVAVQISKYVYHYRADWTRLFNLDREFNLSSWYSCLTLLFCALLLKIIADKKKYEADVFARKWKILSTIFVLLAIDELLSIHEILIIPDLAKILNLPGFLRQIWVIPGAIIVIIFLKKYYKFTINLPKRTRFHFISAAFMYIGGALIMEMIGGAYSENNGQQNLIYALMTNVEEVLEMTGIIIFIYGLLYYLNKSKQQLQINVKFFEDPPNFS